jgi:hypothetical protein
MKIFLRIPRAGQNPLKTWTLKRDLDGSRLWIGSGEQVYCGLEHDPKGLNEKPAFIEKACPSKA